MWLQQMVPTVDGEGRGARYQMQTRGVQGPGQAANNSDGSFGLTFPHTEMEPGCFPSSSLQALVLAVRPFLPTV